MASIPLPALDIKPPAQPINPMDQYAKALQMQGMIQQQKLMPGQLQMQQQQIQAGQLENQQRQQQLKNIQVAPDVLKDWYAADKNPDALPQIVAKHGATQDLAASLIKQQQDVANLTKDQAANQLSANDRLMGHIDAIKGIDDPVKRAQVAQSQATQILSAGLIKDQQSTQMLQAVAQGQHVPTDDELNLFEKGLTAHSAQIKNSLDTSTKAKNDADTAHLNAETGLINKYGGTSVEAQQQASWLAQNPGKTPADFMRYKSTLVPAFIINMQKNDGGMGPGAPGTGGGGAAGAAKPVNPLDKAPGMLKPSIQAVLDYRSPMPPQGRNNPRNNAIRDWVNKVDPTYDETTFPARNKVLTEYVKDASSGDLGAINTALGHLGELNQAAKALSQNNLPLLHSIASSLGAAAGGDAATTYTGILHRVGPEMTSAYVKGGGGQAERGANESDFDLSKGAQQIQSNIAESAQLLNSKLDSKRNNWNNTFKPSKDSDQFDNRFITPSARATLNTLSSQAPTNKGGGGAKVLSQSQIQQAAKDHGVSVDEATRQAKAAGYQIK